MQANPCRYWRKIYFINDILFQIIIGENLQSTQGISPSILFSIHSSKCKLGIKQYPDLTKLILAVFIDVIVRRTARIQQEMSECKPCLGLCTCYLYVSFSLPFLPFAIWSTEQRTGTYNGTAVCLPVLRLKWQSLCKLRNSKFVGNIFTHLF